MCLHPKYIFLFKCDECALIVSVEYEDEEDLESVRNNHIVLNCPCGGKCRILRD